MDLARPRPLAEAKALAERMVDAVRPHCLKVAIAGSIRRERPAVHDIDIVAIPTNQGQFLGALTQFGRVKGGEKILQVIMPDGFVADIYIATPETWPTLMLIRTGSAAHNVMLCQRALKMGMRLHADGRGLFKGGFKRGDGSWVPETPIPGLTTEVDIFKALGLAYKEPKEREAR